MLKSIVGCQIPGVVVGVLFVFSIMLQPVAAQSSAKKANVKQLNAQADKLRDLFIRQSADIAKKYSDAGDYEKSRAMLDSILKIKNDVPGVKAMIKQLDEKLMTSNSDDFEIDVSRNWSTPVGLVAKGKTVRIQSAGSYDFIADLKVGVAGFASNAPMKELVKGVPTGALMGVLITREKGKSKVGRPFYIGEKLEYTPKNDGILMIGLNLPPGHRSKGKVKVRISGYIKRNSK